MGSNSVSPSEDTSSISIETFLKKEWKKSKFLLFISIFGTLAFLSIIITLPFQDQIFNSLYPKPHSNAAENANVSQLTDQLLQKASKNQPVQPRRGIGVQSVEPTLKELATLRKAKMLAAAETNPSDVIKNALPKLVKDSLPDDAKNLIEEEKTVEGSVSFVHSHDSVGNKVLEKYILKEKGTNKNYTLHFVKPPKGLITGSTVVAKGIGVDSEVVSDSLEKNTSGAKVKGASTIDSTSQKLTVQVTSEPSIPQTQIHNVAIFLVNYSGDSSVPYSADDVRKLFFEGNQSINQFFKNSSGSRISLTGTVFDWITLDKEDCIPWNMGRRAADQIRGQGTNLDGYQHFFYLFKASNFGNSVCTWPAASFGPGNPSESWHTTNLFNRDAITTIIHELGHGFGLLHSGRIGCQSKQIDLSSNCSFFDNGDNFDVMGGSSLFYFIAPHRQLIGGIKPGSIQEATSDGTYKIARLGDDASSLPQVLKIRKTSDTALDYPEFYYLSYRMPFGNDISLPTSLLNGASIHIWNEHLGGHSWLINTLPSVFSDSAALVDGRSFYDQLTGVNITQISHDKTSLTVSVKFGAPVCVKAKPTLAIYRIYQSTNSYWINISNNNHPSCPTESFNVSTAVPSGWTADLNLPTGSIDIPSLATGYVRVTLMPPASSLPSGIYPFTVKAVNSTNNTLFGTETGSYVIYSPQVTVSYNNLHPGWNLIGMPINPSSYVYADDIVSLSGCLELDRYQADAGLWEPNYATSYPLEGGRGYMLKCSSSGIKQFSLTGSTINTLYTLKTGWNLIAAPYTNNYTDISDLVGAYSDNVKSYVKEVDRWEDGGWEGYSAGLPVNKFPISRERGYFVKFVPPAVSVSTLKALALPPEKPTPTPTSIPTSNSNSTQNLFPNPSFESATEGILAKKITILKLNRDTTVFHTGQASLRLEPKDDTAKSGYWTAISVGLDIGLKPNTSYTLSGFIKTKNVIYGINTTDPYASGVWLQYFAKYPQNKIFSSDRVNGTRDWTKVSTTFTAAKNYTTGAASVVFLLRPGETTWIDDLSLCEVGKCDSNSVTPIPTFTIAPTRVSVPTSTSVPSPTSTPTSSPIPSSTKAASVSASPTTIPTTP